LRAIACHSLHIARRPAFENFKDPAAYPPKFAETWFKGTGRSVVGIKASKDLFDTSLLAEI
jgi:hypothetical protein